METGSTSQSQLYHYREETRKPGSISNDDSL